MGDLTAALLTLTQEAAGRRASRKVLREATDVVARAMLEAGLRAGDSVTVDTGDRLPGPAHPAIRLYQVVSVTWPVSQWANDERSFLCPEPANTLVMGSDAVLVDVREDYIDYQGGSNRHHPVGRGLVDARVLAGDPGDDGLDDELHLADDDELVIFAHEAAAVALAFAAKLGEDERRFAQAAEVAARLAPN